jgi:simple sugar transport system ATP-binding protein
VGAAICTLDQACCAPHGHDKLNKISLTLRSGEIVAIAGVSGNGQVALAELLSGVRRVSSGSVTFMGQPMHGSPADLVPQGLARIPEDRHAVGVVGDLPVWENAVSERLRSSHFSRRILGLRWIRRAVAMAHAQRIIADFDVRGAGPMSSARALSGGNMQKLILGRALRAPDGSTPKLIVAHQPTWGLDLGAVVYVQQQLVAARDAGAAVLLISDDLDEIMTLGDRVAVMHQGELTTALPPEQWTRESLGLAMAGMHGRGKHAEEAKGVSA